MTTGSIVVAIILALITGGVFRDIIAWRKMSKKDAADVVIRTEEVAVKKEANTIALIGEMTRFTDMYKDEIAFLNKRIENLNDTVLHQNKKIIDLEKGLKECQENHAKTKSS